MWGEHGQRKDGETVTLTTLLTGEIDECEVHHNFYNAIIMTMTTL